MNMCYKNHYYWLDDYGYYYRKRDGTFPHFATEGDLRDCIDDKIYESDLQEYKSRIKDVLFVSCKRCAQKFELKDRCLCDFYYENRNVPDFLKPDIETYIQVLVQHVSESVFYDVKEGHCSLQKFRKIAEKF